MCRFIAYRGTPITLDHIVFQPQNSLVHQSFDAQERVEPLNGDGFGIGFYVDGLSESPARFVSTTPAWNNMNLKSMAPLIESGCVFAHVRAASIGNVSEANCHPFQYRRLLFMHNGHISGFRRIKRQMRERLDDEIYNWLDGGTDSEHFFALFLHLLGPSRLQPSVNQMTETLLETIHEMRAMCQWTDSSGGALLNFALTDGDNLIAARFAWPQQDVTPTLYSATGAALKASGATDLFPDDAFLVVSEKLTAQEQGWAPVPVNHMVVVDGHHLEIKPIEI